MIKKALFIPLACATASYAHAASESEGPIPEGKIIDYPSIYHDVTPSAGPRVIDGYGVFLTGDYLYWTARQSGMQYAATGYTNDYDTSTRGGTTANIKFKFRTGFKAGLGFSFNHDMWDMAFNYTWFQSNHNKGSISGDQGAGITPTFTPLITMSSSDYFTAASTTWRFHFNVVDWELGRNFYISKFLALRPFIGVKVSWQNQHFNTLYNGVISSSNFAYTRKMYSSFLGMGIRPGLNTTWHLGASWSLFGDAAVTAIWGHFHTNRTDTATQTSSTVTPVDTSNNYHTAAPVLELALGIRKDQWFWNNRLHMGVQAGWEEQIWWDQNQFLGDNSTSQEGNLVLQGLTVRLRLDF